MLSKAAASGSRPLFLRVVGGLNHLCGQERLWGFSKARYRGLVKNATRAFVTLAMAMAMANIYLARKPLWGQVRA